MTWARGCAVGKKRCCVFFTLSPLPSHFLLHLSLGLGGGRQCLYAYLSCRCFLSLEYPHPLGALGAQGWSHSRFSRGGCTPSVTSCNLLSNILRQPALQPFPVTSMLAGDPFLGQSQPHVSSLIFPVFVYPKGKSHFLFTPLAGIFLLTLFALS